MQTLTDAFKAKYPKYEIILRMYSEANGGEIPQWDSLTKAKLAKFVSFMQENLAPSSVKTYAAMFKSVLTLFDDEAELPKGYGKILSPRGCISQNTWLTDKEIVKLLGYEPKNDQERLVKCQFVMGCVTGARHSDYSRFTLENIVDGKLVYVSQKTHIKAEIPLAPAVARILNSDFFTEVVSGQNEVTVSEMGFNKIIRRICHECGMTAKIKLFRSGEETEGEKWEFISSHTARRSFATNLYLRCRDIFMVSRLMGHRSVEMTAGYICSIGDVPKEIKKYFRQFK